MEGPIPAVLLHYHLVRGEGGEGSVTQRNWFINTSITKNAIVSRWAAFGIGIAPTNACKICTLRYKIISCPTCVSVCCPTSGRT